MTQITFTPSPTYTPRPSPVQLPTPSPTPNQPRNQSTSTPTHTPSPIPATHVRPTSTPRPTTTLTPFPAILLTPATPPAATGYHLKPWTAEDADNLGRLLEAYHQSMGSHFSSSIARELDNMTAQYAAAACREALLRFPDNPLQPRWQLGDAVNSAISAEYLTNPDVFQPLLLHALNSGQLAPSESEIISWLDYYPSPFTAQLVQLPPPYGYSGSYVITISSSFGVGGSTIWVLENEAEFTAQTLHNSLGDAFASGYSLDVKALTGPEASNLIITIGSHNGTFISAEHVVYDLSQPEPVRLDFGPYYPSLFDVRHGIDFETTADGRDEIIV